MAQAKELSASLTPGCLAAWLCVGAHARRIKILPHVDQQGVMGLRFQHPAPVEVGARGNIGWREEDNAAAQALQVGPGYGGSRVAGPACGGHVGLCMCGRARTCMQAHGKMNRYVCTALERCRCCDVTQHHWLVDQLQAVPWTV